MAIHSAVAQDTLRPQFTRSVVVSHHVGDLCWSAVPDANGYTLYRRFPDQTTFSLLSQVADTHYVDTLRRVVCADTVSYYVEALLPTPLRSDTAGIYYQDNVPTAPCSLRLCSVDTALRRLTLTWYPSPDTDVLGYHICMGSPCLAYDTVWGRLNTQYLCSVDLDPNVESHFRILAFDSCFQASPLTQYYHNPTLTLQADPCSRQLHCRWNRYEEMPDSVGQYLLHYRIGDNPVWHSHAFPPTGPFEMDTLIEDLSIGTVQAFLVVQNRSDTLEALSAVQTFFFEQADTPAYVRIVAAEYDPTQPAVQLTLEVDSLFEGTDCTLMRAEATEEALSPFSPIAQLTRTALSDAPFYYTDTDIRRTASRYVYRLDVPDLCHQRTTQSDTIGVTLPKVDPADAYIPNVLIFGDANLGRFCPHYISPLADGYRLDIYNRHGERLFRTTRLDDCWEGLTFDGRPLPQGVYVYQAHCRHADGTTRTYCGTILLLK